MSSTLVSGKNHDVKDASDFDNDANDELPLADRCSHGHDCHC